MQANLRPPWSYQRPSWLGSAPVTEWDRAWEAIVESPTRVSYTWMVGGGDDEWACCCNENLSYGGRYSGVVRYNRPDWHAHYIGAHTPVPVQLAAHLDKETWAAFAADVEKETATVPPICRYCMFSFCYDAFCHPGSKDMSRSDMGAPACQRVVERHAPALHARGVSLTYFDKGRHIFGEGAVWRLVGFFLDVAAPQSVLTQIQVQVPPGAAPGSTMQVPYNGTMIQCIVPPGAVPGSTFAVPTRWVPTLAPPAPSTFSVIVPPGLGPGMMIGATVPTTGAQIQIALPPGAQPGKTIQVPIPGGGAGAPMAMAAPAAGEMVERI